MAENGHDPASSDGTSDRPDDMYKGFVPCPPDAVVSMDIFGTCVSRDIFGITEDFLGSNGRVKINRYLRGISFVSIFDPHIGPVAKPDDFRSIPMEFYTHESAVRDSLADFNKTALQEMSDSGSEWLMVDGTCLSRGVKKITYSDGSCELISNFVRYRASGVKKLLKKKKIKFKMKKMTNIDTDLYEERLSRFIEFVMGRYGNKIILNCASTSDGCLDVDGRYQQ